MISKGDLETVFKAWYDHKMEPDDWELLKTHRSTMSRLAEQMESAMGHPLTLESVRHAIGGRFGAWMTENGLPKPPK